MLQKIAQKLSIAMKLIELWLQTSIAKSLMDGKAYWHISQHIKIKLPVSQNVSV